MPASTNRLAILFADISGSTALYDKHGDGLARQMIARCISLMTGRALTNGGTLIKTIGDEILCSFPGAADALRAACAMQMAVENSPQPGNSLLETPMHIRIGIHYGEVICEDGDVYGDTVNVAARVVSITRSRQIMATQAVVDALPPDLRTKLQKIQRAEIKGKQEQLDIFMAEWEQDTLSRTRIGSPTLRRPVEQEGELILHYGDQTIKVSDQVKSVVLGRDITCDVAVHSNYASRQHARIEFRYGKFILTDQSMNGTFIRFSDGRTTAIMRETVIFHDSGFISLGLGFTENPTELIQFSITPGKGHL